MKQINDKIFSDSNILVYCYSKSDLKKQNIARTLASTDNVYISTQVLNETANVLHKKYEISWGNLEELMSDCENNFTIHNLIPNDIKQACRIADRYNFSLYDSLIITAALECNCSVLYSEDLQDGQVIDKKINIVNPFK